MNHLRDWIFYSMASCSTSQIGRPRKGIFMTFLVLLGVVILLDKLMMYLKFQCFGLWLYTHSYLPSCPKISLVGLNFAISSLVISAPKKCLYKFSILAGIFMRVLMELLFLLPTLVLNPGTESFFSRYMPKGLPWWYHPGCKNGVLCPSLVPHNVSYIQILHVIYPNFRGSLWWGIRFGFLVWFHGRFFSWR